MDEEVRLRSTRSPQARARRRSNRIGVNRAETATTHQVEHVFARMKAWKILRDCRLKGDGVHTAMFGIARLHNLALTG